MPPPPPQNKRCPMSTGLMTYFMCYERLPYNDQVGVLDQIKAAGHTQLELPKVCPLRAGPLWGVREGLTSARATDQQVLSTSEAAPEAVRQSVGGGCRSGCRRLLSVIDAVEAGVWRQGDSGGA